MFVQVWQGRVADEAGLRRQWEWWLKELALGAWGWLGSTGGIAADGEFVAAVRFDSEESARANGDRPEQAEWRRQTSACFDGQMSIHDCPEVDLLFEGGSDEAGFVQVMQGRVKDPDRLRAIEAEASDAFRRARPDMIGGLRAWHGDGRLTAVDYFTSEAEARKGESRELPPELKALFDEWMSLLEDIRFIDLRDPWLASP